MDEHLASFKEDPTNCWGHYMSAGYYMYFEKEVNLRVHQSASISSGSTTSLVQSSKYVPKQVWGWGNANTSIDPDAPRYPAQLFMVLIHFTFFKYNCLMMLSQTPDGTCKIVYLTTDKDGRRIEDEKLPSPHDDEDNCYDALGSMYYPDRHEVDASGAEVQVDVQNHRQIETLEDDISVSDSDFFFVKGAFIKVLSCALNETGYRVKITGDANGRTTHQPAKMSAWFTLFKVFLCFYFCETSLICCLGWFRSCEIRTEEV